MSKSFEPGTRISGEEGPALRTGTETEGGFGVAAGGAEEGAQAASEEERRARRRKSRTARG
jgi:hypothetical protein